MKKLGNRVGHGTRVQSRLGNKNTAVNEVLSFISQQSDRPKK